MNFSIKIWVIHCAGMRMIAQGTDGLSRGRLNEGVMSGSPMLSFVPTHLGALDRSPLLLDWLKSWIGNCSVLDPLGWYQRGHGIIGWKKSAHDPFEFPILDESTMCLWVPPPFAADAAVSELRKSRLKRQSMAHVFVCPRMVCTEWRKQLYRAADIVFRVPAGPSFWPTGMHEPLLIGILFPFCSYQPWQQRGTPKMYAVGRTLHRMWQQKVRYL